MDMGHKVKGKGEKAKHEDGGLEDGRWRNTETAVFLHPPSSIFHPRFFFLHVIDR
jgi:hypothetical protein